MNGLGSKPVVGNSCQPETGSLGRGGGQGDEAGGGEAKQGGRDLGEMGTADVGRVGDWGKWDLAISRQNSVQGFLPGSSSTAWRDGCGVLAVAGEDQDQGRIQQGSLQCALKP